ncbi:GSCOCG00011339001-RA-CDS [Cotesia congregata]|nr:GSCOCG00011339001-RA-CDS [Cotesia congregata]
MTGKANNNSGRMTRSMGDSASSQNELNLPNSAKDKKSKVPEGPLMDSSNNVNKTGLPLTEKTKKHTDNGSVEKGEKDKMSHDHRRCAGKTNKKHGRSKSSTSMSSSSSSTSSSSDDRRYYKRKQNRKKHQSKKKRHHRVSSSSSSSSSSEPADKANKKELKKKAFKDLKKLQNLTKEDISDEDVKTTSKRTSRRLRTTEARLANIENYLFGQTQTNMVENSGYRLSNRNDLRVQRNLFVQQNYSNQKPRPRQPTILGPALPLTIQP